MKTTCILQSLVRILTLLLMAFSCYDCTLSLDLNFFFTLVMLAINIICHVHVIQEGSKPMQVQFQSKYQSLLVAHKQVTQIKFPHTTRTPYKMLRIQEIKLTCFWARITHMLKFWSLFRLHTMRNSLDLPIGLTLGGVTPKNMHLFS